MKTIKILIASLIMMAFSFSLSAQSTTETFKVAGVCGMCKNKIESAAKKAGATEALWDVQSKELIVTYYSTSSNAAKIQKSIAKQGYDTKAVKASDVDYEKLHACCQYDRTAISESCCSGNQCSKVECKTCCKDGKCTNGMDCCKDGVAEKGSHATHEGEHEAKAGKSAACCKKA
jgi:hypothetical protein